MLSILATDAATAGSAAASGTFTIIWLVVLVAIMYFMTIRPQQKEEKLYNMGQINREKEAS